MPRVDAEQFFEEQSLDSRVKAEIVVKYAIAWSRVFLCPGKNRPPLATHAIYVDFFSGPGTYDDGNESTPLQIARKVVEIPALRHGLELVFNDDKASFVESLRQEIWQIQGAEDLAFAPRFSIGPATLALLKSLKLNSETPQLFFLDQFGWSDVEPDVVRHIFQARRCDCIFFFRTSRVVAALTNPRADLPLRRMFGAVRVSQMREAASSSQTDKEALVHQQLREVMRECGAPFFLAFPFKAGADRSSKHHLIYLGKNERGFGLMKDIMSRSSSVDEAGVPVIGHAPGPWTPSLFEPDPITELMTAIRKVFAGKRLSVGDLFIRHHPTNDRFILSHYQEAIRRLEQDELVTCTPSRSARQSRQGRVTMSETVMVSFPADRTTT